MHKLIWIGLAFCIVIAIIDRFVFVMPYPVLIPLILGGVAVMIIGLILGRKKERRDTEE